MSKYPKGLRGSMADWKRQIAELQKKQVAQKNAHANGNSEKTLSENELYDLRTLPISEFMKKYNKTASQVIELRRKYGVRKESDDEYYSLRKLKDYLV